MGPIRTPIRPCCRWTILEPECAWCPFCTEPGISITFASTALLRMYLSMPTAYRIFLCFRAAGRATDLRAYSISGYGMRCLIGEKSTTTIGPLIWQPTYMILKFEARSEEHTSELQSPCNLVC